jgi:alkylation response protein AidB-like acyl-CoA dehydrogenase
MDAGVNDDQRLIMETSARFIREVCPLTGVRQNVYRDGRFAADYWRRAAELGWFSMLVPERLGGGSASGNGLMDAALIAYERGRGLQPGPFVGTNVAAYALGVAGSEAQQTTVLPGLLSGVDAVAWVAPTHGDGWGEQTVRALRTETGYRLSGLGSLGPDGEGASWLLVTAAADQGELQFLLRPDEPGIAISHLDALDLTRRFAEVRFDGTTVGVSASLGGQAEDTSALLDRQLAVACVLTVAESVGAMDLDFEMALQYAKDRVAFGRPIGSFQAIKHLLADTSLLLEMSKAAAVAAATNVGADDGYGLEAASIAKAFVGDSGIDLAQNCFQVFGGIGFTWEHDQHLYLRRLTTDAALFGDPAWHRERLCQLAGLQGVETP